ncbi:MAG: cysteine--tRNA ligase [Tenericutes bacterium]|nr:cysteine--tRNA ligase [Mycoplasmatota bacterium]
MKIYNTLTKKVEEFIPNEEGKVKMYTCGPTVYHYAHIGNLRTYISEDILEKGLRFIGYDVERVMNITDVGHLVGDGDSGEDKMLVASKREHKSSMEIAKYYTDCFFNDCMMLNIKKPDVVSPATANIEMYIKMIQKLLDTGYAYIAEGNVYYDTSKFPNYYELSGRNSEDLMVAVREDIEHDTAKRNPFDFGLWFTNSKFNNQELQWDSPWGRGYPGWHIECSGISIKYLGEKLDIHCGAEDAIFPHHTNEIAQSEAYLGHKWCNYWVHLGFLNDESGKMSKSKGEFLTVSLLKEKGYDPLSYRYLCLNSYYHSQLTFSYDILDGAQNAYFKLKAKVLKLEDNEVDKDKYDLYIDKFKEAIHNDLNSSNMLTLVYDVLKEDMSDGTKLAIIKEYDKVLSLDLTVKEEKTVDEDLDKEINEKILLRKKAKENKDFALADKIRDELLARGIKLIDTREGTIYELV